MGDPTVRNYIRQYRAQYPRDTIDYQLQRAGFDPATIEAGWAEVSQQLEPILIREYVGKSQQEATRQFKDEAPLLADYGYRVVAQSWDTGRRGKGAVIAFGVFSAFAPKHGTLTVTYQLR